VKKKVNVSDEPEMVGAIGAALLALKRLEKIRQAPREQAMVA
jgi:activator of 2-hydroxyglutaryl-CoA dehydratase